MNAQRRFTIIGLTAEDRKHNIYIYSLSLQPLQSGPCMLVLILPTLEGSKTEWTSGKEGYPNIQSSTMMGIEPGTSGFGGIDLATTPDPPLKS